MTRYHGKVWFDDMIYIWSQEKPNDMIADVTTDTEEEDCLLRMRGVGRGATREEQKGTAQRFVDCWNACEGIESPLDLRRQRDELREALIIAQEALMILRSNYECTGDDYQGTASIVLPVITKVLTKTKESV